MESNFFVRSVMRMIGSGVLNPRRSYSPYTKELPILPSPH